VTTTVICVFNVTSDTGDVHFEASSPEERDCEWHQERDCPLDLHLVAGDTTASSRVVQRKPSSKSAPVGDLPGLEIPSKP
jgi:hypothetical protein